MNTNTNAPVKETNKLGSLVKAFHRYYVPFIIAIVLLVTSVIFTILTPANIRSLTNEISPVGKTAVDGNFVVNLENVLQYAIRLIIFIGISFVTSFVFKYDHPEILKGSESPDLIQDQQDASGLLRHHTNR